MTAALAAISWSAGKDSCLALRTFLTLLDPDGTSKSHALPQALRESGHTHLVFGDIDLQAHRDWLEPACARAGLKAVFPLGAKPARRWRARSSRAASARCWCASTRAGSTPRSAAPTTTPRCSGGCPRACARAARKANSTPSSTTAPASRPPLAPTELVFQRLEPA